jgi:hypothetical protein
MGGDSPHEANGLRIEYVVSLRADAKLTIHHPLSPICCLNPQKLLHIKSPAAKLLLSHSAGAMQKGRIAMPLSLKTKPVGKIYGKRFPNSNA